jgi:hypothetical protein
MIYISGTVEIYQSKSCKIAAWIPGRMIREGKP